MKNFFPGMVTIGRLKQYKVNTHCSSRKHNKDRNKDLLPPPCTHVQETNNQESMIEIKQVEFGAIFSTCTRIFITCTHGNFCLYTCQCTFYALS